MAGTKDSSGKAQQPEALASLEAAARSGSKKPDAQGLGAKSDTAPHDKQPEDKQAAAAAILKKGAEDATGRKT